MRQAHLPPAAVPALRGKLKLDAPVPPGARLPTGRYLAVTVNRSTFKVMDLSIGNHRTPVSLRTLGPVTNMTARG